MAKQPGKLLTEKGKMMMKAQYELTDTFAGEANYSWVKRTDVLLPDDKSILSIVRKAKAWAVLMAFAAILKKWAI